MSTVLPREEAVETIFSKILASPEAAGELLPGEKVSAREYAKFKETYEHHECAPRSALYLADGYDLVRTYTEGLNITEEKDNRKRGVLALYALPDTCKLGLTEAQAYAVVWDAFQKIQEEAPRAMVYYGQETGLKKENPDKPYDEIGILLPIHEFEKKMLQHYWCTYCGTSGVPAEE